MFTSFFITFFLINGGNAINCFKCISRNGSNMDCEDPFHARVPPTMYHAPCWTGRKDRNGTFPATHCTKIHGVFEDGSTMMVRDCALDSGSLTTDTELVRMSHCGGFHLDNSTHLNYVRGCVQSCHIDGCNHGTKLHQTFFHSTSILFLSLVILTVNN